ncbi:TolC family protein [Sulfurimonas sp.]
MQFLKLLIVSGLLLTPLFAKRYSVDEAIKTALCNNQKRNISAQDRRIAQAKYKQSLSANYPTLDIKLVANRKDEAFVDEVKYDFVLPPQLAGALGTSAIPVDYTHTIMGRDTQIARADAKYALYTGGKISALQKQAKAGMAYTKEAAALTDEQIVLNVKKYYAALILATKIEKLMQDTVDKMQATYELTSTFYKGASMKVKKTDYLRAKMTLLNMKSILESFKNATKLAKSALRFEMGLKDNDLLNVVENSYKAYKLSHSLENYYETLYLNNHQLKQTEIGLEAKDAKIDEMKSGFLPTIGLYANAQSLHNNKSGGLINSKNNDSWNIGVAMTYNLFNGGLSTSQTQEAKAEKLKLKAQQAYLKSGLKLKAKKAFLNAVTAQKQVSIMQEATDIAKQNSDLNFRAYQEEMVDTKDVLESQFMCSLTEAGLYRAQYAVLVNEAELEFLVGKAL